MILSSNILDLGTMNPPARRVTCASHLRTVFTPDILADKVKDARAAIEEWEKSRLQSKVDAFVGCGISGITFASVLAYVMNRHLVVVRKRDDINSTSQHAVEGINGLFTYLFVDDLVASGSTLRHVVETLRGRRPGSVLKGIYTYAGQTQDEAGNEAAQCKVTWVNNPDYQAPRWMNPYMTPKPITP